MLHLFVCKMAKKKLKEELEQYDYVDDEYIDEVSPDYIEAIGLFVLNFSALEHQLNIEIAEKINPSNHLFGYQIVELLSAKSKIDLFSRLINSWIFFSNKELKTKGIYILSKLKGFNSFRNKVIHANWMSLRKDGTVRTSMAVDDNGEVQFERTKLTSEIINKKSEEISKFLEELEEFIDLL